MSDDAVDESDSQSDSGYDSANHDSHPSLGLTLQESRNLYEDEEDRRRTAETKIGILISLNAIVISIVASIEGIDGWWAISVIATALTSAAVGLYILWPQEYQRPGPDDINDIFADAQREQDDFQKQFINDYRAAISTNQDENDVRFTIFKICAALTFISIFVIFLSQIPYSDICGMLAQS
ncbi:hypothetical protein ACLI4R_18920 [Natrialbaceae archaeon A-chndr2]